jgi:adenylate cyclase
VGDGPQKLLASAGVYRFSLIRSELRTAQEIAAQMLHFGETYRLALAMQTGHLGLGITSFGLGEFRAAREHLSQALNLYDASMRSTLATAFGDDPAVVCLSHTAMTLWFLGLPDQALARSEEALACARETGLAQGLVFALNYATWCRLLRREAGLARAHAEELVSIARRSEFAYWIAQATAVRGWVLLETGEVEQGVAEIRRGLEVYEAIGAEVMRPWHLVRLAEAYGAAGRVDDGLALLEEALATMTSKDERFYEAELYRIEGELRGRVGDERGAEERFTEALGTARRQGATSLELRVVVSLARLLKRQRREGEAKEPLESVSGRFIEGTATGDVRAARELLADLSR